MSAVYRWNCLFCMFFSSICYQVYLRRDWSVVAVHVNNQIFVHISPAKSRYFDGDYRWHPNLTHRAGQNLTPMCHLSSLLVVAGEWQVRSRNNLLSLPTTRLDWKPNACFCAQIHPPPRWIFHELYYENRVNSYLLKSPDKRAKKTSEMFKVSNKLINVGLRMKHLELILQAVW
jgi:hypothetical protein